jgi:hypothetical protein
MSGGIGEPRAIPNSVTARDLSNASEGNTAMKDRNDASSNVKRSRIKPHAVLGAGNLTSAIWKAAELGNDELFYFNVFRMDAQTGDVTQRFAMSDILDLIRLAQVLAIALSEENCLDDHLRDDLACLASCLDEVLPSSSAVAASQSQR